jgi:beta-glucosidase
MPYQARLLAAVLLAACGGGSSASLPEPVGAFPPGFLWGTAIAPYQVEGGLTGDDWYAWETECRVCTGERADDGPDFFAHWEADLDAAAAMKNTSIRLGIDWSRLFPTEQALLDLAPDPSAVARYHQILAGARARGLEPMLTLHHFATPTWLEEGWEDPEVVTRFETFARWAAAEYGGEVDWWVTINEPMAVVAGGYLGGMFPPGHVLDTEGGLAVLDAMLHAHVRGYDAIHEADVTDADGDGQAAMVSIASHNRVFQARTAGNPDDERAASLLRYVNNTLFFEACVNGRQDLNWDLDFDDEGETGLTDRQGRMDWVGVNYYGMSLVIGQRAGTPPFLGLTFMNDLDLRGIDAPISDFGWAVLPRGLRTILDELAPFGLPILVTENGLADADDDQRPRFLVEHLYEIARAVDDGIDVRGYYHWTLMDNFEWAAGYCPRFGLVEVDFSSPDKTRTPRASADVYRRIIESGTVAPSLFGELEYGDSKTRCNRQGF